MLGGDMKVRCENCGWRGTDDELAIKYNPNPLEPGDVIPEPACPDCGSEFWDSIEVTAGRSVELGYPSGRRVRYLYNHVCSEQQSSLFDERR
jgi:DNA-directed RNA polymerase subunit RPC12/RpoP